MIRKPVAIGLHLALLLALSSTPARALAMICEGVFVTPSIRTSAASIRLEHPRSELTTLLSRVAQLSIDVKGISELSQLLTESRSLSFSPHEAAAFYSVIGEKALEFFKKGFDLYDTYFNLSQHPALKSLIRGSETLDRTTIDSLTKTFSNIASAEVVRGKTKLHPWGPLPALILTSLRPTEYFPLFLAQVPDSIPITDTISPVLQRGLFREVLLDLPARRRGELLRLISQRIITFSPKSEKNTTNDGERMYGGTAIRRNLEAMQRLLLEHTLRSYHDHLPKQMSHAQFFDFLDHHFTIVRGSELTTSGDRGNYDARLVSDTVYLLRDAFRDQLAGNGQNEIYVYGSFVNGKANLATSDLDILMNEPMLNAHYLPYFNERTLSTEDYRHWEAPIRSDHTGDARGTHENQERWRRAERAIAHRWTGHDVEPGHLLKIFPRKRSETKFVDFSIFASYNPLVIKINRDGIHLIIYNAFEPGLSHDVFISN